MAAEIFFPERKVVGRMTALDFSYISSLVTSGTPVYYYAFEDDDYLVALSETMAPYNVTLSEVTQVTDTEKLLRIIYLKYGNE